MSTYRDGEIGWLQSSSPGDHEVTTPALDMGADFQLDLHAMVADEGRLTIILECHRDAEDFMFVWRDGWSGWQITLPESGQNIRASRFAYGQSAPLRIVREGAAFRLILQDQSILHVRRHSRDEFVRVRFQLSGPAGAVKLFGVELNKHPLANRGRQLPFVETFNTIAEGQLPAGWSGSSTIAVRRDDNRAWMQPMGESGSDLARVKSPRLDLAGDFAMDVALELPDRSRSRVEVSLLGAGTTPDLIMYITADGSSIQASLTGASAQKFRPLSSDPFVIRLIREGSAYRLLHDDETVLIGPRREDQTYEGIAIGLSSRGSFPRLYGISIALPEEPSLNLIEDYKPAARRSDAPASLERVADDHGQHEEGNTGGLSGRWQTTSGSQFQIADDGTTLSIELIASNSSVKAFAGDLTWNDTHRFADGQVTGVFQYGTSPTTQAIRVRALPVDSKTLRLLCQDFPIYAATGRLMGTRTQNIIMQRK